MRGRWTWYKTDHEAHRAVCPACQRIIDYYPAGYIQLSGPFFKQHRQEILNLIRNIEKQENEEHPLERIIAVIEASDRTFITTTGVHLARRIGESLSHAYKGDYSFHYAEAAQRIRVSWHR